MDRVKMKSASYTFTVNFTITSCYIRLEHALHFWISMRIDSYTWKCGNQNSFAVTCS